MTLKRALVVDDSRSARAALRKLLEEHDLEVAEADSGESALDYLKRDSVDVIFMDHTMPGMDGLEAVSAIKANPQTATVPVMMYTTKEGEVYVGQARALGAVGVLPKNVQPHQLFEMLLNLGLVHDRRGDGRASRELADAVDEVDRALEDQALGISVQALVTRILEDQHLTLRSDILRSQKTFAREVAHEILKEQAFDTDALDAIEDPMEPKATKGARSWLVVAAFVVAFVCAFLAWQFKNQRDIAYRELVAAETSSAQADASELEEVRSGVSGARAISGTRAISGMNDASAQVMDAALAGFAQLLTSGTDTDMYLDAFGDELARRLDELLPHIENLGFRGQVVLTSHVGNFCLTVDDAGNYRQAAAATPLDRCDYFGHVLEDNDYVSERLSVEFSRLLQRWEDRTPDLRLVALTAAESQPLQAYPNDADNAGEWNAVARRNNRVVVTFVDNNK